MTVTGVSIMTVPVTVGVSTRRNSESRAEKANWKSARAITSVTSRPGPPAASAATLTAIAAPGVPMARIWPAPNRPARNAWSIVVAPHAATEANTAQSRTLSGWPAAWNTTVAISTAPGRLSAAIWRASPVASGSGMFASGRRRSAESRSDESRSDGSGCHAAFPLAGTEGGFAGRRPPSRLPDLPFAVPGRGVACYVVPFPGRPHSPGASAQSTLAGQTGRLDADGAQHTGR